MSQRAARYACDGGGVSYHHELDVYHVLFLHSCVSQVWSTGVS